MCINHDVVSDTISHLYTSAIICGCTHVCISNSFLMMRPQEAL